MRRARGGRWGVGCGERGHRTVSAQEPARRWPARADAKSFSSARTYLLTHRIDALRLRAEPRSEQNHRNTVAERVSRPTPAIAPPQHARHTLVLPLINERGRWHCQRTDGLPRPYILLAHRPPTGRESWSKPASLARRIRGMGDSAPVAAQAHHPGIPSVIPHAIVPHRDTHTHTAHAYLSPYPYLYMTRHPPPFFLISQSVAPPASFLRTRASGRGSAPRWRIRGLDHP